MRRLLSPTRSAALARISVVLSPLCWFAAGVAYCIRFNPLDKPFAIDNQIYFFTAERVASGVPPHISLVDHKNALSSLVSGIAIVVGRWFDIDDAYAVRALSCAVAGGTVAAVWLLAYRLRGRQLEAHVAALAMLAFVSFFAQGAQGVRPKLFMAFFMTAGLASFAGGRLVRGGLLSTSAFLCWQPALLVPACLGVASLFETPRLKRGLRFAAGALAALTAYELYFLWHGALGEQLFQTYVMSTREEAWPIPAFADSIRFMLVLGHVRDDASKLLPALFMAALALVPLALLIRPRRVFTWLSTSSAWSGVIASAATAWAFTLLNHQAYPDLFFIHPFIALTTGLAVGAVFDVLGRISPAWPVAVVRYVLVAVLAAGVAQIAWARRTIFRVSGGQTLTQQRALAVELEGLVDRHGRAWAIGCLHLLALNRMDNFLPYGLLIDPNIRTYMLQEAGGKVFVPLDDEGNLPALIFVSRGGERKVMPWLPRLYERLPRESFRLHGISIWVQRRNIATDRILKLIQR